MCQLQYAINLLRKIADFQFGKNVGAGIFPEDIEIIHSKGTGRIRYVYLRKKRLVTLRPTDGMFSLSIHGAKRIVKNAVPKCSVTVRDDISKFIREGRSAFAKHVIASDLEIRPQDEVIVLDQRGEVLAVGRAALSGEEMMKFETGVAVRIRHGNLKES